MNYSTLKKTVVLSFVSLMAVGMAKAQTATTDTSKTTSGTAKVFGGTSQYNTWSVGINLGALAPNVFTGGVNEFNSNTITFGYGVSLKDQLTHSFGLQLDFHGGELKGSSATGIPDSENGGHLATSFTTKLFSGTISGVWNFGNVSFLHRTNGINFYLSAGAGLAFYTPDVMYSTGPKSEIDWANYNGSTNHKVKELVLPVGLGAKFRLTDQFDLNVGYTENFVDGFNLTGVEDLQKYPAQDKYGYGYVGAEYTFGTKGKPSLEWANPVAMMYDELYDAALRQEVEALKGRVGNVENAVTDLKKDSDGDGVADQFDKCPNTPAGSVVDGSGCPIVFPKCCDTTGHAAPAPQPVAYSNIQFEFDSSVLKTSSYPVLDATSADLRSSGSACELDGFASSEGTAAHNMRLSRDRANSVKTYLVNSGVDAKKLKVKAFGETHPVADNSTEAGRILNRRVEFHKK